MQRIILTTILGFVIAAVPVVPIDHTAFGKGDHAGSSSKGGGDGKSGKGGDKGGGPASGAPSGGNGKAKGGASAGKGSDGGPGKSGSAGAGQKGASGKGSSNKGAASSASPPGSGASFRASGPPADAAMAGPAKLGIFAIARPGVYAPVHRAGSQRVSLPGRLRPERAADLPQARHAIELALQGTFDLLAPSDNSPVSACRQAITVAAQPLGALRVSVGGLGPVRRGAGGYVAPIGVSIRYPRETRQARIQCRLNSAGVVIGFR